MSPSSNLDIWFALGFKARARHVDYPRGVDFKGDRHREQKFQEGWAWANAQFQYNKVPYEPSEILALERKTFEKAKAGK